jgi:hypothetical protein
LEDNPVNVKEGNFLGLPQLPEEFGFQALFGEALSPSAVGGIISRLDVGMSVLHFNPGTAGRTARRPASGVAVGVIPCASLLPS